MGSERASVPLQCGGGSWGDKRKEGSPVGRKEPAGGRRVRGQRENKEFSEWGEAEQSGHCGRCEGR